VIEQKDEDHRSR